MCQLIQLDSLKFGPLFLSLPPHTRAPACTHIHPTAPPPHLHTHTHTHPRTYVCVLCVRVCLWVGNGSFFFWSCLWKDNSGKGISFNVASVDKDIRVVCDCLQTNTPSFNTFSSRVLRSRIIGHSYTSYDPPTILAIV
jgi:hypothetical protein